jgi:hypothetical protein
MQKFKVGQRVKVNLGITINAAREVQEVNLFGTIKSVEHRRDGVKYLVNFENNVGEKGWFDEALLKPDTLNLEVGKKYNLKNRRGNPFKLLLIEDHRYLFKDSEGQLAIQSDSVLADYDITEHIEFSKEEPLIYLEKANNLEDLDLKKELLDQIKKLKVAIDKANKLNSDCVFGDVSFQAIILIKQIEKLIGSKEE